MDTNGDLLPNRRTSETDWQDVASLLRRDDRNIEDPELRTIISQCGGPTALAELRNDLDTFDVPKKLNLPTPGAPLREWTVQSMDPAANADSATWVPTNN